MMKTTKSIKEPRILRSAFGRYLGMDGTRAFPDHHRVETTPTRKLRVTQRSRVGPSKPLLLAALFSAVLLSLSEAACNSRWGKRPDDSDYNLGNIGEFNRKLRLNKYNHRPRYGPGTRFYDPDHGSKSRPISRKKNGGRKSEHQDYAVKQGNECESVSPDLFPPPMPSSTHCELTNEWNQFVEKTKHCLDADIKKEIPTGMFKLEDVDLVCPETQTRILNKYNECLEGKVDAKSQFHKNFRLVFHAVRGDEPYFEKIKREGHPYPPSTNTSQHQRYGCVVYCAYHINHKTFSDYGRQTIDYVNGRPTRSQTLRFVVSAMFLQNDFENLRSHSKFLSFGDGSYLVPEGNTQNYTQHWVGANRDGIFPLMSCEMQWNDFEKITGQGKNLPGCHCKAIDGGAPRPLRDLLTNDKRATWRVPDIDPTELWRAQMMTKDQLDIFRTVAQPTWDTKRVIFELHQPLSVLAEAVRKYNPGNESDIALVEREYWFPKLSRAQRILYDITIKRETGTRKQRSPSNSSSRGSTNGSSASSCSSSNGRVTTSDDTTTPESSVTDDSDYAQPKVAKPKARTQQDELELEKLREDRQALKRRKNTMDKTAYLQELFDLNQKIHLLQGHNKFTR